MLIEELSNRTQHRAAGVLIYARDTEKFLFIKRSLFVNSPDTWSVPGGHADAAESPWQTACREAHEEIGENIALCPYKVIWTHRSHFPQEAYCLMACAVDEQFQPQINWESSDCIWCDLSEIPMPRHWGIDAMLSNDQAGQCLHDFLNQEIG